ncbi:glycosyltransferase family 4 protein [Candidatus Sumerlaeota bacterium]|nr:glycosyltransferase family 4 protein [Candidatus Sumerlaeota bacterium]
MLREVVTAFGFKNQQSIDRIISKFPAGFHARLKRELGRRNWSLPDDVKFSTHGRREFMRAILSATKAHRFVNVSHVKLINSNAVAMDRAFAQCHLNGLDAVYCYEDTAALSFKAAKSRGIQCLYDLPIMHHRMSRDILREEVDHFPEFRDALQAVNEPEWKIERKEQEISLADHIFVASSVTLRSLQAIGIPMDKVSVVPYGGPVDYFHPIPRADDKFRVAFIGLVGPRKGVHYLLRAWRELNLSDSELMLVGALQFPEKWFAGNIGNASHTPSVPHAQLNQYYGKASVFVFPSLVEGFAMVLLEAMACGIPIITTANTAGPDIITDGVEGFIVPLRDVDALKEKIQWCRDHPDELRAMGVAARRKAEHFTWQRYRESLASECARALAVRPSA